MAKSSFSAVSQRFAFEGTHFPRHSIRRMRFPAGLLDLKRNNRSKTYRPPGLPPFPSSPIASPGGPGPDILNGYYSRDLKAARLKILQEHRIPVVVYAPLPHGSTTSQSAKSATVGKTVGPDLMDGGGVHRLFFVIPPLVGVYVPYNVLVSHHLFLFIWMLLLRGKPVGGLRIATSYFLSVGYLTSVWFLFQKVVSRQAQG